MIDILHQLPQKTLRPTMMRQSLARTHTPPKRKVTGSIPVRGAIWRGFQSIYGKALWEITRCCGKFPKNARSQLGVDLHRWATPAKVPQNVPQNALVFPGLLTASCNSRSSGAEGGEPQTSALGKRFDNRNCLI